MSRKFKRNIGLFLSVTMLVCMLFPTMLLAASNGKVKAEKTVHLKGMKIKSDQKVKLPYGLEKKGYQSGEEGPYIIVFSGPIESEMKTTVINEGAELINYLPDFSFLAMMTPEEAVRVEKLSCVDNIMIYQPAYKVHPSLKDEYGNVKAYEGEVTVKILTFDDNTSVLDNEIINARGKKIKQDKGQVIVKMHSNQLEKFAIMNSVKYIEEKHEYTLFNDVAKGYIDVDDMWDLGFDGTGQVVGIADTGLDTGKNDSSMHLDFQGRIDAIFGLGRYMDENNFFADDPHGHGTHVAGSVLGNGARSNGQIKGMAPGAHLVFQSILGFFGGLDGIPADLGTLFGQAWDAGAQIHSNSWGTSNVWGDYTSGSINVDQFVSEKDMIILFAAGNDGEDESYNLVYNTINAPGTAKNCITVGASESYRPGTDSWGDNPNEVAIFSSKGWCTDGRIKPDIVTPGSWILSTRSSEASDGNFWDNYDSYYAYMGGTSMATPIAAGAVAVARQYMQEVWNHTSSPAMMKAALINGATDMGYGVPSKDQGWGRINLFDSLVSKEYLFEDETYSLNTGQTQSFTYNTESANTPLKISLVWSDYQGATSASIALVNDLDLKVISPSGVVYYGNDFTSPFNSDIDRLNNVENVFIDNPEVGTYIVEVNGYNVPQGPQSFALFSSGDFSGINSGDDIPPTCSIDTPTDGATVSNTITINATAADNEQVIKVEFYVDSSLVGTDTTSPYSFDWNTTTVKNGNHTLQAKAYDGRFNNGESSIINVTVANADTILPTCNITAPAEGDKLNGTITLSADASDNDTVDKVEFYANGTLLGTDTISPYSFDWDTTTVNDGSYTLEAKAYDVTGNVGTSSISVTVDNTTQIITKNFTGTVDKNGTVEESVYINVTTAGDIDLSLTWDSSADIDMYLYNPSGTEVAKAYSTKKPETISYSATTIGQYQIKVKAYSSSANYTLTATYPGTTIVDTTAPSCSITAPVDGATVSGTTTISATASDNIAVDQVEFYANGSLVGTDTTSPYSYDWNTASVSNGNYTVEAKAYDAAGNVGTSSIITVTVDNIVDTTAPTCAITAPTDGTTVSGTTTISATASDDVAVDQVEFYVNGSLIGTDTTSPYSYDWDTTSVANGSYSLEAKAYDAAGNVGTSTIVYVTVDNGTGTGSEVYTGTVSTTGSDGHEFFIDVTGPCTIDLHLDWIGTGDLDLYLYTPGGSWADTSFYSKPETISYSATTTGQYRILVDAYSGSGDYTLTVTY